MNRGLELDCLQLQRKGKVPSSRLDKAIRRAKKVLELTDEESRGPSDMLEASLMRIVKEAANKVKVAAANAREVATAAQLKADQAMEVASRSRSSMQSSTLKARNVIN